MSYLHRRMKRRRSLWAIGDDTATAAPPAAPSSSATSATSATSALSNLKTMVESDGGSTMIGAALLYHGYRRTGSLVWALLYGLAGREAPAYALPIALAQGFGARRICTTTRGD